VEVVDGGDFGLDLTIVTIVARCCMKVLWSYHTINRSSKNIATPKDKNFLVHPPTTAFNRTKLEYHSIMRYHGNDSVSTCLTMPHAQRNDYLISREVPCMEVHYRMLATR
jgi:hypothetical protein